jgi:glycosyltransferase involved in cell wall biosynthesis
VKILLFSTLYPNAAQPLHGLFVERRLLHVVAAGVEARVIAPVPWFPLTSPRFGDYATFAKVPTSEIRNGLEVVHPRYPLPPKVGMSAAPVLMALATLPAVRRVRASFRFDLIDAHYYYPDGVAAALLASWLDVPVTITARGTDINLIPQYRLPRAWIRWAARRSSASIAVCEALRREMVELGIDQERIRVLRNGVDLELFRPLERPAARAELGLGPGRWLLSVGQLIERKGHDLAIRALAELPGWSLIVAGEGPLRRDLEALASGPGLADRVRFAGAVPQSQLPTYYSAVDALVLASSREGWANVLLEAMACGTPVVASPVWGTPEVVAAPEAGVLMAERSAGALAASVKDLLDHYPDRRATRAYAEAYDWAPTTRGQLTLFEQLVGRAA